MGVLWSLTPVVILMKISGIPTSFEQEVKSVVSQTLLHYFWRSLNFISLLLNCFFQLYNFVRRMIFFSACTPYSFDYWKLVPFYFAEFAHVCLEPFFVTGVPLVFAFQFYFTGRFRKIWNSLSEFDKKPLLPTSFYRNCRKRRLLLISISLLELTLFVTLNPTLSSMITAYNFGKIFNLGHADICNTTAARARIEMPPAFTIVSLGTGMWVQSSVIAVLTLFCALISISSLLAKELNDRTKKETFRGDGEKFSFALDEWLSQFHKLHCLVESIQEYFSPLLVFTIFYYFFHFPYQSFELFKYMFNRNLVNHLNFNYIFREIASVFVLFSLRLGTIVIVGKELKEKIEGLQNSLNRLPSSLFSSPKQRLQRENVGLQVSAQLRMKITAYDICYIDMALILKLLGVSLTYACILVHSAMSYEKE